MRGLSIKYYRHVIEKIGAATVEPKTLVFKRLKEAIEGTERMDILLEEDLLNV